MKGCCACSHPVEQQYFSDLEAADVVTLHQRRPKGSYGSNSYRVNNFDALSATDNVASALLGERENAASSLDDNLHLGFYLASSAANAPDGLRIAKKKRRKMQSSGDIKVVEKRRCYPLEDEISLNSLSTWPGAVIPSLQDIAIKTRFTDVALLERVLSRSVVSGWLGSAINIDVSDTSDNSKADPTLSQGVWAHRFVALTPSCIWIFMPHVDGLESSSTSVVNSSSAVSPNDNVADRLKPSSSSTLDRVEPLSGPPALKPEKRLVIHVDSAVYGISGSDFQVYSDGLLITLRAASEAEASAWLVHIHSCISAKRRSTSEFTDPDPIALSDNHLLGMAEVALDESSKRVSRRVSANLNSLYEMNAGKKPEPVLDSSIFDIFDTVRSSSSIKMRNLLSHFPVRMRLRAFARRVIPEHVPLLRAWEMMSVFDIHQSSVAFLGPKIVLKSAIDIFDRFFGRGASEPISLPTDVLHALSLDLVRCGPLTQDVIVCPPANLFVNSFRVVEDLIKLKLLGPYSRALSCLFISARQSPNEAVMDVLISSKGGLLRQLSRSSFSNIVATGGASEPSSRRNSMSPGENPQPVSRRSSLFSVIPDAFASATASSRSRSVTRAGSFLSPTSPSATKSRSKSMVSAADSSSSPAQSSAAMATALNLSDVLDSSAADISGFDFDFDSAPTSSIRSALPPSSVDVSLIPRSSLFLQGRGLPSIQQGTTVSDDFVIESVFPTFSISITSWRKNWQRSLGRTLTMSPSNIVTPNEKVISWVSRRHGVDTEQLLSAIGADVVPQNEIKDGVASDAPPLPAAVRALQDAVTEAILISNELRNMNNMHESSYSKSKESSDLSSYLYSALFGECTSSSPFSSPSKDDLQDNDENDNRERVTLDSRSLVARSSHPLAAALSGVTGKSNDSPNQTSSTSIRTIVSGVLMNPSFGDNGVGSNFSPPRPTASVTKSVLEDIVRSEFLRLTPLKTLGSRKERIAALGGRTPLNTQLIARNPSGLRFISVDGADSQAFSGYPVPALYSLQVWASFSSRGFSTSSMSPRGLNDGSCVIDISVIPSAGSATYAPKRLQCDLNAASYAFSSSLSSPRTPGSPVIQGRIVTVVVHADGSLTLYDNDHFKDSSDAAWGLFSPPDTHDENSCTMLGLMFLSKALDITLTNDVSLPRHCVDVVMPGGVLNLIAVDGDSSGLLDALSSASRTKAVTTHALVVPGAKSGGKKVRLQVRSEILSVRLEPTGMDLKISSFVPLPFFLSSSSTGSVVLLKGAMYKRGKIRTAFARREMRVTASFTTITSTAVSNAASASSITPAPATDLDKLFQHIRSGPYRVPPFSRSSDQRPLPLVVVRAVGLAALDRAVAAKESPLPSLESLMESVKITDVKLEYSKGAALRGSILLWSSGATHSIGVVPEVSHVDVKQVKQPDTGSISASSVTTATDLPSKSRIDSRKKWIGDTSGSALSGSTFFALYTEGRVWQFACDDANEAREWVAILSALCSPRDSAVARTLPKTRPGFSSADESLMKAILINSSIKPKG